MPDPSTTLLNVLPRIYAAGPIEDLLNPLALPASIVFSATPDGHGMTSPPFSHAANWSWWHQSGASALAAYAADALAALRGVADATGHAGVGAAIDVLNGAATPQAARDFLHLSIATTWAEAAEGLLLLADPAANGAAMYAWGRHATDFHAASAQAVHQDAGLAALALPLAGGGTVFSTLADIVQFAQTTQSFQLGMAVPGLPVTTGDRGDVVMGSASNDTVAAGAGWDAVFGFEGNDSLAAGDGYDVLWGGAGDDTLDGGNGVDTAMYSGTLAEYVVTNNADGSTTVSGPDGTDTLVGIERLRFSDGLMALDTQGCDGTGPGGHVWQVAALVQAAFGRLPTPQELTQWTAACDRAPDMAALAQQMIDAYASGAAPRDVIGHLYQQIVREQATAQIIEAYAAQIGPGAPYETLADWVAAAACHPLNTHHFAHLVGTPQLLDPAGW